MNIEDLWHKAITKTEIYRARLRTLHTFDQTILPYIYLGESLVNSGDVVVRKGKIAVERPIIFLPGNFPQFEGFQVEGSDVNFDSNTMAMFLLMRGISFPTMKYSNETYKLEVIPGPLQKAVDNYKKELERKEDVATGLIISTEDCWQFAALLYAANLAAKSMPDDIKNILKRIDIKNN
jgi:hypothetical protein